MSLILQLALELWVLLAMSVILDPQPGETFRLFSIPYQKEITVTAAVYCDPEGGLPVFRYTQRNNMGDFTHELVHVGDCLDDGDMNGSFGPPVPEEPPSWLNRANAQHKNYDSYCWNSPSEFQGCRTEFDPGEFLQWLRQ